MNTRRPVHAGSFYPADTKELSNFIQQTIGNANTSPLCPKALIVPHAGYQYSGHIAAVAYAQLLAHKGKIKRVLLLGPNHRVALADIAAPTQQYFASPLGRVKIDQECIQALVTNRLAVFDDEAHQLEHALEVQLPFLQKGLDDFQLLPLAVGKVGATRVAQLISAFWQEKHSLIVISSDLSHFESYEQANIHDQHSINSILALSPELAGDDACGCRPLNGLLHLANNENATIRLLAHCNSGDSCGDNYCNKQRVVGYASFAIYTQ